jgi:hypothetical protein
VIGVIGAATGTQVIRSQWYGVEPSETATLSGGAGAMAVGGRGAWGLPALRAAKIDPAVAIRRN